MTITSEGMHRNLTSNRTYHLPKSITGNVIKGNYSDQYFDQLLVTLTLKFIHIHKT